MKQATYLVALFLVLLASPARAGGTTHKIFYGTPKGAASAWYQSDGEPHTATTVEVAPGVTRFDPQKICKVKTKCGSITVTTKAGGNEAVLVEDGSWWKMIPAPPGAIPLTTDDKLESYDPAVCVATSNSENAAPKDRVWSFKDATSMSCKQSGTGVDISVTKAAAPAPGGDAPSPKAGAPKEAAALSACESADYAVLAATIPAECGKVVKNEFTICVDLNGNVVGERPVLESGGNIHVVLLSPSDDAAGTLGLSFKKDLVLSQFKVAGGPVAVDATKLARTNIQPHGSGTIEISIQRTGGSIHRAPGAADCNVTGSAKGSLQVEGDYYLSLAIAPIYSWHRDRDVTSRVGGDGVRRIVDSPSNSMDVMLDIVFYPWGVRETTVVAGGLVLGTSISQPGRSWMFGPQLSFPVAGVGITAGGSLNVVKVLPGGYFAGQPWSGSADLPTKDGVQPGFYFGINVEDELFKRVFKLPK